MEEDYDFYALFTTDLIDAVRENRTADAVAKISAGTDVNIINYEGKSALFYAVQGNHNEDVVNALISAGANSNARDHDGRTALFYAVQENDNEGVVQELIKAGADVNICDGQQRTALIHAVLHGNKPSVIRTLITAGADVNAYDGEENNAVIHAVLNENESLVQTLIDAEADVNAFDGQENTVLISAVLTKNESLVRKLIAARADVNIPDIQGKTALFHAVKANNLSLVKALIDAGAKVNVTDKEGKSALFYAVQQRNSEDVVRKLINAHVHVNKTDFTCKTSLFYAVQHRNSENVVRILTNADGADVNRRDLRGRTALFYAVQQSHNKSTVRALIDGGANVNIADNEGKTALAFAVQQKRDNKRVVCALIDGGADVNRCDTENKTALIHAVESNNEAEAVALLKAGANVNQRDKILRTCLIYAVLNENKYLANALIEYKANVNATDIHLRSALIYAVYNENDDLVRALIRAGADLNITDIGKKTALIRAIENNSEAAALALIEAGADLNKGDKWMKTALVHAVLGGNEKLVAALIAEGANVNASDINKRNALTHAVREKSENVALVLIEAGINVNLADDCSKTPLIYVAENDQDYFCYLLVDHRAAVNEDETKEEFKMCLIDSVAANLEGFICECFAMTKKIAEDMWLASVMDELETAGDLTDEQNEVWLQAYRNVQLYGHEWQKVLACAVRDNKHLVKPLVHQDSSIILSEYDIKAAISCTAKMEYEIMIAEDSPGSNERKNKGVIWIQEFIARVTSSDRKLAIVNALLKEKADVNQKDIRGESALIHALQKGKRCLANILIQRGADVNIVDKTGRTALLYAVKNNESRDMVQSLINAGADIDYSDYKGKTALIYAVHNENHSLAKTLIEAGADLNITDNSSKSALIYAVEDEKEWLARQLIEKGADVQITDKKCRTPLMFAVQNERAYLARALIAAGSDVNATDNEYKTALIHAVQNQNGRLASFLISQEAAVNVTDNEWKTALIYAAKNNGDKDLVCSLIEAGTDVNTIDKEEKTALMYAVQNGNRPLTSALIAAGTDVNITDDEEATALIYAIQNNYQVLACDLIESGSEVNFADSKKRTALIYAAQNQLEDITVKLIKAGANVHATDHEGKTALFYAVQNEFLVCTLLEAGADANVRDNYSRTPLFDAVGNEFVVRQLIEDGTCNVKSKDVYGRSPLCYALTKSLSSSHYLLLKGEKIDSKDYYGLSNLSFFIDHFLLRKIDEHYLSEGLKFFVGEKVSFNVVFQSMIDAVFCKILSSFWVLTAVTDVLMLSRLYVTEKPDNEVKDSIIQDIVFALKKEECSDQKDLWESQVPGVLNLLIELGANANSVDSDGNTALHYATCLPFAGVSQVTVKKIFCQLQEFGVLYNIKNQQGETPLLFCLRREVDLIKSRKQKNPQIGAEDLVYVWEFLLEHGASVEESTADGWSALHLVLNLFNQGLRSLEEKKERDILNEALSFFELFASAKMTRGITVNRRGRNLNSPLHQWASLRLNPGQEYGETIWEEVEIIVHEDGYESMQSKTLDFKKLLTRIFHSLRECGIQLNDRNAKEETPLHLCRTWTAVELLLDAGANPDDKDAFGRPPLLAAAKKRKFGQNSSCFYPDFLKPEEFWTAALKKGLEPWTVDKNGESVLGILIASEAFVLANALLDVASTNYHLQSNTIALSLLNSICKDASTRTYWKSTLLKKVLKSRKSSPTAESGQDTPLHHCCRNILKTPVESTVHWSIAKLLLSSGTDYSRIPNRMGETCFDIAKLCPPLKELLTRPIDIYDVPLLIPWMSVSERYQSRLAETARRRDCWHVESYWCHKNPLDSGSFGLVFAGINEKDGREVAIKRIEKHRMKRREDKREIQNLTALADCEQVVRYLSFSEDENFCYIVLELMEGNLDDCLENAYSKQETIILCKDVVKGLKFLHEHDILHRDLKPSNILYKCHPKLCLKIADFGLSRRIDNTCSTSVYGTNVGTRCWIAPEVLKSVISGHSKSSDTFACGLLLHYMLSGKRHPFASAYSEIKSVLKTNSEIETNIKTANMEGWDHSIHPEAAHLVEELLQNEESKRPSARTALAHPLFWSKKNKLDLLRAVGNQPEFSCPRALATSTTLVEDDLEASFPYIVKHGKWNAPGYVHMPAIYTEMNVKRKTPYNPLSTVELVRFIRNSVAHVSGSSQPTTIRKLMLEDFVFLEYFPNLVMEVYKAVTTHGWDLTREEIKYAIKK